MWVKLAEMCLNVVLGDSLRKRLADEADVETEEISRADLSPESDEDEDDSIISTETKKRRRRWESGPSEPSMSTRSAVPRGQPGPVSAEQIEFGSLLALLTSSSPPFLAVEYPDLGSAMLNRLLRFLRLYPADTSLHPDFIVILSATLSHLALNKRDAVTRFAQGSWDALLGMWGTKNKKMKENLIIVLRTLFPFYTTRYPEAGPPSLDFSYVDGVSRLWHLLGGEAESRWGVDGLSLDSLRLSLTRNLSPGAGKTGAFMARTFQYGLSFDANQAMSWTILELQADCAEKVCRSFS
jgi:serine-protein kinase ATM